MAKDFLFSISISPEPEAASAPIVFQGNLRDTLKKTKALGYDAVELQLRNSDRAELEAIRVLCQEEGMAVSAIATGLEYSVNGLSMIDDDPERRAELRRRLFRYVELAEKLDCPVIVGCIRGNLPASSDPASYWSRFREEMRLLCGEAEAHGVPIVLEAINFYVNNYLNSIRETCDFIDSLGQTCLKLHVDTHHMAIQESRPLEALRYAGNRIGYVHFAENDRRYPGAGSLDFWSVMRLLKAQGYKGFIALEVKPEPDADTCAARGIAYLSKLAELVSLQSWAD